MKAKVARALCLLAWLAAGTGAGAELRIEITRGVDNAVKLAVVPFGWQGSGRLPLEVAEVIAADLGFSGRFETLPNAQMLSLPTKAEDIYPRDWEILGVEYLVIGRLTAAAAGPRVALSFELYDVARQAISLRQTLEGLPGQLRDMAHHVSDQVFEQLTGVPGVFSTRIVYVTVVGEGESREFRLNLADADGQRAEVLLRSPEPLLSATWSPDGKSLAYVSFEEDQRPAIYLHDLGTGERQKLTAFAGLNGAPAFSPDGRRLALVLSKDGNPDIYILDLHTKELQRVTRHYGIDTEPFWSPDGDALVFTSNRGGQPQIYQLRLADSEVQRLTFEGSYNAKPSLLPDGKGLVMVHRREGVFHIALLELDRGRLSVLTETSLDESPTVAPNGAMLMYATQARGRGILAAVSIDGGVRFNLPATEGEVREPAWSPTKRSRFAPIR